MQPINIYDSQNVKVTIDENGTPVQVTISGCPVYVEFYADYASLPNPGQGGIMYVVEDTNYIYRWDGAYIQVGGGSLTWGQITGTLSNQTDLQTALDEKVPYTGATQNIDIGTNWITANDGTNDSAFAPSFIGVENSSNQYSEITPTSVFSYDNGSVTELTAQGITFPDNSVQTTAGISSVSWGDIQGTLSNQTDLQTALDSKVDENTAITGDTKTKITYDSKGLVTSGADAGIGDITGLQNALDGKVDENTAIISATKTKITYDSKGLVTSGADAGISDITGLQTALDSKVDENATITGATKTKITYDSKGLVTSGTDAGISDISGLQTALDAKVPYTGATGNVTLGEYGLTGGYYQFDTSPTTYTQAVGKLGWNDTEGTIEFLLKGGNVDMTIGEKLVARVVNGTGGNVLKSNYQVVKVTGAQGQRLQVNLAQGNNDANSTDTLGLIAENISNNQSGFIITSGLIEEVNTSGSLQSETWSDGDILYLSPTTAGKVTNIKPQAPNHSVIVGFVVYAHSIHGKIFVKVDNGYELDELHNVKINTGTLSNGQVLKYNSTLGVWENNSDAGITGSGTSNEIAYFNSATTIASLTTVTYPSLTELSYVKGVTSAIQTQLNAKEPTLTKGNLTESTSSVLTISGGTGAVIGSGTTIQVKQSSSSQSGFLSSTDWSTFNGKESALTFSSPLSRSVNTISIPVATSLANGYLSSTDWSTFNGKQAQLNGTGFVKASGTTISYDNSTYLTAAITSLGGLTASTQTFAVGTSGTDFAISSATSTHTFNLPTASATNRGALSSADWTTFNNKQNALTNPVTGTGTTNELTYFSGTSAISSLSTATYPSLTELSYVKGVTSSIQTQLNGKQATLTNPITGTGTSGQIGYFNGTTSLTSSATLTYTPTTSLLVNNSVTASGAIARGTNLTPTLVAAANNDVLVGLDINPTFTNGPYTGISNNAVRINSTGTILSGTTTASASYIGFAYFFAPNLTANQTASWYFGKASASKNNAALGFTWVADNSNSNYVSLAFNGVATPPLTVFASSNISINSTTDSGYRLDINGTARVQGALTTTSSLTIGNNSQLGWGNGNYLIANNATPSITLYLQSSVTATFPNISTSSGGISPNNDNAQDVGQQFSRYRYGWFGTSVIIGSTASPAGYMLDVNGTARVQDNLLISKNQNAGTKIDITNNTVSTAEARINLNASSGQTSFGKRSSVYSPYKTLIQSDSFIYNDTNGDISILNDYSSGNIKLAAGGSSTAQATLFSTGNLAIGTTTDSGYKLDVNGTARTTGNFTLAYSATKYTEFTPVSDGAINVKVNGVTKFFIGASTLTGIEIPSSYSIAFVNPGVAVLSNMLWKTGTSSFDFRNGADNDYADIRAKGIYSIGDLTISDAKNIILSGTTGTKIGTATSQKISFWNATPIVQPTTAVAAATLTGGGGTALTDTDTFDGYTLKQIVKALRNTGLLA